MHFTEDPAAEQVLLQPWLEQSIQTAEEWGKYFVIYSTFINILHTYISKTDGKTCRHVLSACICRISVQLKTSFRVRKSNPRRRCGVQENLSRDRKLRMNNTELADS